MVRGSRGQDASGNGSGDDTRCDLQFGIQVALPLMLIHTGLLATGRGEGEEYRREFGRMETLLGGELT